MESFSDNIIDRSCTGCTRYCDSKIYHNCASSGYQLYERVEQVSEVVGIPEKPKYFSKIFEGWADEIATELNRSLTSNPEYKPIETIKLSGGEEYGDKIIIMVVFGLI